MKGLQGTPNVYISFKPVWLSIGYLLFSDELPQNLAA